MAADKPTNMAEKPNNGKADNGKDEDKPIKALTEEDIAVMQAYGAGPYSTSIKKLENEVKDLAKKVNEIAGIKESDTGLAHPSRWDLVFDKQMMQEEAPLQVNYPSQSLLLLYLCVCTSLCIIKLLLLLAGCTMHENYKS